MRNGEPMVMACPIPLCALSGAITTILPKSFTASTNAAIPGAVMPSSLVIRIIGSSFGDALSLLLL